MSKSNSNPTPIDLDHLTRHDKLLIGAAIMHTVLLSLMGEESADMLNILAKSVAHKDKRLAHQFMITGLILSRKTAPNMNSEILDVDPDNMTEQQQQDYADGYVDNMHKLYDLGKQLLVSCAMPTVTGVDKDGNPIVED